MFHTCHERVTVYDARATIAIGSLNPPIAKGQAQGHSRPHAGQPIRWSHGAIPCKRQVLVIGDALSAERNPAGTTKQSDANGKFQ